MLGVVCEKTDSLVDAELVDVNGDWIGRGPRGHEGEEGSTSVEEVGVDGVVEAGVAVDQEGHVEGLEVHGQVEGQGRVEVRN